MSAALTCHRYSLHGGYDGPLDIEYNNSSNSRPLHIVQTALASTPLSTNPDHVPSDLAVSKSPVEFTAASDLSDIVDNTMLKVTEITEGECTPSIESAPILNEPVNMESETVDSTERPKIATTPSDTHRIPKRKRTASPPSPSSSKPEGHRSASRSTRRSGPSSCRSSPPSHRRAVTSSSLTPSPAGPSGPESRRETLLALHRDSCRLFQDNELARSSVRERSSRPPIASHTSTPTRPVRTFSDLSSPPLSPKLHTQVSISSHNLESSRDGPYGPPRRTYSTPSGAYDVDYISPIQESATVIDWTSPSTRRREYKKIDRASSGVRGFWRRVAPRWCQFGDNRMPFFEEKDGKGNYEGSVRRFRMDVPDEPVCESKLGAMRGLKLKRKLIGNRRSTST